jgi:lysophospholipid acyltransferase (LPLAT)-like uncharacterized protein
MQVREFRQARVQERQRIVARRERCGRNVRWRRLIRRLRRGVGGFLLNHCGATALRLLVRSWRIECLGLSNFEAASDRGTGFLNVLWHGRMLPLAPSHRHRGTCILVSASADGSLVPKMLNRLGHHVIRGSSSRRGALAIRDLRECLQEGDPVVITPDGPIGPRHSVNIGLAWLARETGLPILTIGISCARAWHVKSWDRFTIPKPRSRIIVTYGDLIRVGADADEGELERVSERVREQLMRDEARGFEELGVALDW